MADYVSLRQNHKWQKTSQVTRDTQLHFADIVNKINRSNGKISSQLLVITSSALLLLDQRTFHAKYRVALANIESISLSPHHDTVAAFHLSKVSCRVAHVTLFFLVRYGSLAVVLQQENGDGLAKKGDVLLASDHMLEIVTKIVTLGRDYRGSQPSVHITTQYVT